jgi:gluconolactonase
MKKCFVIAVVFCVMTVGASSERAQTPENKSAVVRRDPALDGLISPNAELQMVKSGFGFTEGTNWVQRGKTGYLLFSDIPANVVDKMLPDGTVSVFLDQSGYHGPWNGFTMATVGGLSNNGKDPKDPLFRQFINVGSDGLTLDPQGRLVICTFAGRSVDRIEKNGKRVVLADHYEGKRLNGPNDVIVKKNGTIYFSDMYSGMRGRANDPSKELDYESIFMIKDGKVALVAKTSPGGLPTTNGLALSPDEKYIYVNGGGTVWRYEVQSDDTFTGGQLFLDLRGEKAPGVTDGVRVDSKGNVYESGAGGIWIVSPEGKILGTILTPEIVANLTFGDPDWKTLYIAARTSIYKIRVNTPGLPCNSCSSK